jgi:membrane protein
MPRSLIMPAINLSTILRQTFSNWNDHEVPRLGAALAFYTILSLAPLVILVLAVVALIFGDSGAQSQILGQVQEMIGRDGAAAVKTMIENGQKPASGIIASLLGIGTLVFGASGVFVELRSALNKIWDVKLATEGSLADLVKQRFSSFAMVFAIGFLLLVSLLLSAALVALGKFWGGLLPLPAAIVTTINILVSFGAITILFALIFKYVPEAKIAWSEVWAGSAATAFLFTVGKFLIGIYLGKAAVGSAYGAAGSLIVVIVWVYYSSMIFFFGAELTHVLARPKAYSPS